jgi:ubiquinone/menaquinone biosynthesis C-methylase UbiE
MIEMPAFRKPDRYKASSYRSYNFKMPACYDTAIWSKYAPLMDQFVVQELGPHISSLRILDVGCATGRLLKRLAEAGATQLSGADLAPGILAVAAEKMSEAGIVVDLRTADAEDCLPWDDEFFDAATLTGVLHHFFRPRDSLAEVRRILRPGGRLLIIDGCLFPLVRQIINTALRVAPHDGDCHFYSTREAAAMLADLEFEILQTRRLGWGAYFSDSRKPKRD